MDKKRNGWLSRQRDGSYMFTLLKPVWAQVGRSEAFDWYMQQGEPFGYRHLCPFGTKIIWGIELPIGGQVRAWVCGGEKSAANDDSVAELPK